MPVDSNSPSPLYFNLEEIKARLGQPWIDFQTLFENSLEADCFLLNTVNGYLIQRAGKQLRPVIALLVGTMLGKCGPSVVKCAVAGEMIHNATLLHDDVADEADLRRGDATIRSLFSPSVSVLSGDYWLARAVKVLLDTEDMRIVRLFGNTIDDLAQGELLQLAKAGNLDTSYEDYLNIIRRKTASLFMSTAVSAAIAAGGSAEQTAAVRDYACHLGLAFQMRDDIFDYCPSLKTGKLPGVDITEHKITIPLLCAFQRSTEDEIKAIKELMLKAGNGQPGNDGTIARVEEFVREKGGIESAQIILSADGAAACAALSAFSDSWAKETLCSIARFVCNRDM